MNSFVNFTTTSAPEESLNKVIDELYSVFAKIFGFTDFSIPLLNHLTKIAVPVHQPCAKKLSLSGAWSCRDCEVDSTCVLCVDCFEKSKEKHKGHRVLFKTNVNGCCDCGDPDAWKIEGSCDDHIGAFKSEKEINDYINQSFQPEILEKLTNLFSEKFLLLNKYFLYDVDEKKINYNSSFHSIMDRFLDFIYKISKSNMAFLHLLTKFLLKSYNLPTKHQCYNFDNGNITIYPATEEDHECKCPFVRALLSVWGQKIQREILLYILFKNLNLKIALGLSYFSLYTTITKHRADILIDMKVQFISKELSEIIGNSNVMIESMLSSIYNYIKELKENSAPKYEVYDVIKEIQLSLIYLFKPSTTYLFSKKTDMYKRLIDIASLIHHVNQLTVATCFQREGWDDNLGEIEFSCVNNFSFVCSINPFTDENQIRDILNYFLLKIAESGLLPENSFSFHITLLRCFSIFLSRYLFCYAYNNKVNIKIALDHLVSLIPNIELISEIVIKDLFKFIGFITSIDKKYWVYYGEAMYVYPRLYYLCKQIYVCDLSLLKIFMSINSNKKYFSLENMLRMSSVNGSNNTFIEKFITNKETLSSDNVTITDANLDKETLEKHFGHTSNILTFLLSYFRYRSALFEVVIIPSDLLFRSKNSDQVTKSVVENEKENFILLTKQFIIVNTVASENSVVYSDFSKFYPKQYCTALGDQVLENIIESITSSKILQNQKLVFSIKDEALNMFDLDFLFLSKSKSNAENYLMSFKKNIISILNTFNQPSIAIQNEFDIANEMNFLSKENVEFIFFFFEGILKERLTTYGFFSFIIEKFIIVLVTIAMERYTIEIPGLKERCNALLKFIEDKIPKSERPDDFNYLLPIIAKFCNVNLESNVSSNPSKEISKNKKKLLQEKMKKQFQQKNEKMLEKYDIVSCENEENKSHTDDLSCVICRNNIDKTNITSESNSYGRFGLLVNDSLFYKQRQIALKKLLKQDKIMTYKKYRDKNITIITTERKKKYAIRLLTCKHLVHFSCYQKFKMEALLQGGMKEEINSCPLCKGLTNFFIPEFVNSADTKLSSLKCTKQFDEIFDKNSAATEFFDNSLVDEMTQSMAISAIENFLTTKGKGQVLINDLKDQNTFIAHHENLVEDISSQFTFIDVFEEDKQVHMESIANILISLRCLVKAKIIKHDEIIKKYVMDNFDISSTEQWETGYKRKLITLLFDLMLILSEKDFNDNEFIKMIISFFLPFIALHLYLKFNYEFTKKEDVSIGKIKEFYNQCQSLNANNPKIEVINEELRLLLCKIMIAKQISNLSNFVPNYQSKTEFSLPTLLDEFGLGIYKSSPCSLIMVTNLSKRSPFWFMLTKSNTSPNFFEYIIPNFIYSYNSSIPEVLPPFTLLSGVKPRVSFIPLPESFIDLISIYQKRVCYYCKKLETDTYICLICGKNMCHSKKCVYKGDKNKLSFLYHTETCTGGTSAFLSMKQGDIIFVTREFLTKDEIVLYRNQFGEGVSKGMISNEFTLSMQEYEKTLKKFMKWDFRKRLSINPIYLFQYMYNQFSFENDSDGELDIDEDF